MKKLWHKFTLPEKYSLLILVIYLCLALIYFDSFAAPLEFIALNVGIIGFIFSISYLQEKISWEHYYLFRNISIVASLYVIYSQIFSIIDFVNPTIIDPYLIKIDRWILGGDVSDIANQITHPAMTEVLQVAYFLFFVAMLSQGVALFQRVDKQDFAIFMRTIIFGFYFSYIGYVVFPAIGPRFTVGDFAQLSNTLPGLLLTEPIRGLIDSAGNISIIATAAQDVNKDCMPSGHTMMTVINLWLAYRLRTNIRHVILVVSFLIIFSTLYLQYHYLIDMIAGIICAFVAIALEPYIAKLLTPKDRNV